MKRPRRLLPLLLLPLAVLQLGAKPYQDPQRLTGDAQTGDGAETSPVVVTPGRAARTRFEVGRSVDKVNRTNLRERQVDSAHDALRQLPGVTVQQTNRGAGIPVIRGLVGPSNVVLVDGLRFNQATWRTGPSQYFTLLDPSAFRAFEVLTGPASLRYGAGAMGGVTAALPWKLRKNQGFGGRGVLRFISQDTTASGSLHVEGRQGAIAYSLGGALRQHGQLTTGSGEVVALSDWQQRAYHAQLGWDLSKTTTLKASFRRAAVMHAGRVDQLARGKARIYDNNDDYATLDLRHRGAGRLKTARLAVAMHRTDERVARFDCADKNNLDACVEDMDALAQNSVAKSATAQPGATLKRERRYQDKVNTIGGLGQATVVLLNKRLSLELGAEAWQDTVDVSTRSDRKSSNSWAWKDASRGNLSPGTTWLESGAWLALDGTLWQRGDQRLLATVGGRGTYFRGQASAVPGLGDIDYSNTGVIGSGGLRFISGSRWMVYLDVSQGYRAPNVQETTVLGDTGSKFEVPNSDLGPERGLSAELGGRLRRGGLQLHLSAFINEVSDFIGERQLDAAEISALKLDPNDVGQNPVIQRVNRDTGRFIGAQGQLRWQLPKQITAFVRGGWTRGDVTQKDGSSTPARRVMPLAGTAGLRWIKTARSTWNRGLWFELYSDFSAAQDRLHPSDRKDLRICADSAKPSAVYGGDTCTGTPGWATVNLRGGWRLRKGLSLDAALTNVLNAAYRVHGSGFDAPGAGVSVSLSGRY